MNTTIHCAARSGETHPFNVLVEIDRLSRLERSAKVVLAPTNPSTSTDYILVLMTRRPGGRHWVVATIDSEGTGVREMGIPEILFPLLVSIDGLPIVSGNDPAAADWSTTTGRSVSSSRMWLRLERRGISQFVGGRVRRFLVEAA
jgi:hypothetical protein